MTTLIIAVLCPDTSRTAFTFSVTTAAAVSSILVFVMKVWQLLRLHCFFLATEKLQCCRSEAALERTAPQNLSSVSMFMKNTASFITSADTTSSASIVGMAVRLRRPDLRLMGALANTMM